MSLDRSAILHAGAIAPVPVEVPEWGGTVYVRPISGAERDAFELAITPPHGRLENIRARLVALCACDAQGARLFTDADVPALGALPAVALERVALVARRVNALGAAELEEVGKN